MVVRNGSAQLPLDRSDPPKSSSNVTGADLQAEKQADFAHHQRTYRAFVRGVVLVTAHAAAILLVLAYVFADRMG